MCCSDQRLTIHVKAGMNRTMFVVGLCCVHTAVANNTPSVVFTWSRSHQRISSVTPVATWTTSPSERSASTRPKVSDLLLRTFCSFSSLGLRSLSWAGWDKMSVNVSCPLWLSRTVLRWGLLSEAELCWLQFWGCAVKLCCNGCFLLKSFLHTEQCMFTLYRNLVTVHYSLFTQFVKVIF